MVEEITMTLTVDEAILVFVAIQMLDKPATEQMAQKVKLQLRDKLLGKES